MGKHLRVDTLQKHSQRNEQVHQGSKRHSPVTQSSVERREDVIEGSSQQVWGFLHASAECLGRLPSGLMVGVTQLNAQILKTAFHVFLLTTGSPRNSHDTSVALVGQDAEIGKAVERGEWAARRKRHSAWCVKEEDTHNAAGSNANKLPHVSQCTRDHPSSPRTPVGAASNMQATCVG